MKSFAPLFVLCLLGLALGAGTCKKEDDTGPSDPVGDNDYIEFKLNDTLKRIIVSTSIPLSSATSLISKTMPQPYLYANWSDGTDHVAGVDGFVTATLQQYSRDTMRVKRYAYPALNTNEFPAITYFPRKAPTNYFNAHHQWARGFIEITRMDPMGGRIEGTFAFDSVRYINSANGATLSEGHRFTEGKFRVKRL